jgi:small conductance mechanosensitive channel
MIFLAQADTTVPIEVCGIDPGVFCESVYDWTENESLAKLANWLADKPLRIFLIALVASIINRVVRRMIRRVSDRIAAGVSVDGTSHWYRKAPTIVRVRPTERSAYRARTIGTLLRSLASIVIYTIATFMILDELNIDLRPLFVSAGIAGVALGFGAQSIVRDFLSGTLMMIEDAYGVGDNVDLGEAIGVVEKITLRSTRVRDVNGQLWIVPNGEVRRVANRSMQWRRAVIDIPVAPGADLDKAKAVMRAVARTMAEEESWSARVLEQPEVWGVESVTAQAVTLRLVEKTDPGAMADVERELRQRIIAAFVSEGIPMATAPATMPGAVPPAAGAPA